MPRTIHTNNTLAFLGAVVAPGDTTIILQTGEGAQFPAASPIDETQFFVTVDDRRLGVMEIMLCTERTADSLTVTRAQQGTIAQSFAVGTSVSNRVTGEFLNDFDARIDEAGELAEAASIAAADALIAATDALDVANEAKTTADATAAALESIEITADGAVTTANAALAAANDAAAAAAAAQTTAANAVSSAEDAVAAATAAGDLAQIASDKADAAQLEAASATTIATDTAAALAGAQADATLALDTANDALAAATAAEAAATAASTAAAEATDAANAATAAATAATDAANAAAASIANYLPLAGGTMSGPILFGDAGGLKHAGNANSALGFVNATTLTVGASTYTTQTMRGPWNFDSSLLLDTGAGLKHKDNASHAFYFPNATTVLVGYMTYTTQKLRGPWVVEDPIEVNGINFASSHISMVDGGQIRWPDSGGTQRQAVRGSGGGTLMAVGGSYWDMTIHSANPMKILVAGSESARFAGTGGRQLRCESMHAVESFDVDFDSSVNRTASMLWPGQIYAQAHSSASNTGATFGGWWGTTKTADIRRDGNMRNTNNSYGALSDSRLKKNVADATPKLEDLNELRIVNFEWIDPQTPGKQIGVIAQEAQSIFPTLVSEDEDGNLDFKYSVLVPMLVKAVQELTARLEAIEAT